MFKNYFKTAWRNLTSHRFYSLVNIGGLSVGLTFTLLIGAFVWSELRVNKELRNAQQQYIILSKWKDPNMGYELTTLGQLAKALKEQRPDLIANYYRYDGVTTSFSKGGKSFREDLQIGDSTLLNMFGFKLLLGNPSTALKDPYTIVISSDKAKKYFGKTDVLGQTITIENFSGGRHDFLITGVIEKKYNNSVTRLTDDYPIGMYVSAGNLQWFGRNMNWNNPHITNYIELQNGASVKDIEKQMQYLVKQNSGPGIATNLTPYLMPLANYYLNANNGVVRKTMFTLSGIALFILVMAIINFVNTAISRSSSRMREIGVRKVLGGLKTQLIVQFLTESVLLVFIAMLVSIGLFLITRTLFSAIVGKEIPSLSAFPVYFIFIPILLVLIVGLVAGIYPALVLSSLKSVDSLKGKLKSLTDKVVLRKSLVAFQFATAAIVLVGTIIISQQISLFFSKNLGYNKAFILSAQLPRNWSRGGVSKMETIREEFARMPQVKDVSLSFEIPDGSNSNQLPMFKFGSDSTQSVATSILENDEKFLSVYQIPLIAGTPFEGHRLDSLKVILNETATKALGWRDARQAIGQQVKIRGNTDVYTIRGVTRDFRFGSMQTKVPPIIMFNLEYDFIYRYFSFKIKSENVPASIYAIQHKWAELMPGAPFEYRFMDETLKNIYKTEIQLRRAANIATLLALIIVLLGIVGLVALGIQKRTKEIGIRKVLGSSVREIVWLFIKEFAVTILIGAIVACPVAYILMHNWLGDYAYHITITPVPFLIAIVLLALVTISLVIAQTIKAASANPVKSLRTE